MILDGKVLSQTMEKDLRGRVEALVRNHTLRPALATILVGQDPSSKVYVNMKAAACQRIGLDTQRIELSEQSSTEQVLEAIDRLNSDDNVFGILLQHPVPPQIDERRCFNRIAIEKDVDGVTAAGFGQMALGEQAFVSATPGGIMELLNFYNIPIAGKRAIILGRSPILGKPIAMLLLNANATVTIAHSKTTNLKELVLENDIVVAAVGKPHFVEPSWIKAGAVIVDAGYHPGGKGDVNPAAYAVASAYTPVPGGVGPMTIVTLMKQTVEAAEQRLLRFDSQ